MKYFIKADMLEDYINGNCLTRKQFSLKSGVNESLICKLIRHEDVSISIRTITKLAKALKINWKDLIRDQDR